MNRTPLFACTALLLAACGSRSVSLAIADTKITWDAAFAIDHPYFPLRPGASWSYAGESDGHRVREELAVQDAIEAVDGTACLVMVEQRFVDEEPEETTFHWYTGDATGRLWIFGERTIDAQGNETGADGWLAGRAGAVPLRWLSRKPAIGDRFELRLPSGTETMTVVGTDASVTTPAGTFTGCVEAVEDPENGTEGDMILYAPGIGRVLEADPMTRLVLTDHR